MAHQVETMAYQRTELPWHNLGAPVDPDVSIEEMMEAAGLNWKVELHQLKIEVNGKEGRKELIEVPGRFALVRDFDHRILTVTGQAWKPMQNRDALEFMRDYLEAGGLTLETAGSLRNGKIVWCLAKLAHEFRMSRNDTVKGYLLMTVPHEVGRSITVRTTSVRVVCGNTLHAAESEGVVEYRQNHLTDFDFKAAKERVEQAHTSLSVLERNAKKIAKLKLSMEDAVKKVLVPAAVPVIMDTKGWEKKIMDAEQQPKTLREIIDSINNAPGAQPDNGWGILNGYTHWTDHVVGRTADTRMYRAWVGDTSRTKQKVMDALLELAQ